MYFFSGITSFNRPNGQIKWHSQGLQNCWIRGGKHKYSTLKPVQGSKHLHLWRNRLWNTVGEKVSKNSARGVPSPLFWQCTKDNIFSLLRCSLRAFVRCTRQVLIYSMCRSFPKLSAYDKKDSMTLNMKAINQYTLVTHYVALQNTKTLPCLLYPCLQHKSKSLKH